MTAIRPPAIRHRFPRSRMPRTPAIRTPCLPRSPIRARSRGAGSTSRGAFARPSESIVKPGLLAPREPPAAVQELPPDQKPEGDNVVWIPGYWSWDEDRADYLWVSGFFKVASAGRRKWVPGYWNQSDTGWQWVSGFWADANANEVPYVQSAASHAGSRSVAAAAQRQQFLHPGLLAAPRRPRPVAAGLLERYPSGPRLLPAALFVDAARLPVRQRLLGSSPGRPRVCFSRSVYFPGSGSAKAATGLISPRTRSPCRALLNSLWVRPGAGYYAFGDYYATRYALRGYQPWVAYGPRYRDPLYSYSRWVNRGNPAWAEAAGRQLSRPAQRQSGAAAANPGGASSVLTAGSRSVSAKLRTCSR